MPKPKSAKSLVQISLDSLLNTLFPKVKLEKGKESKACLSRQFDSLRKNCAFILFIKDSSLSCAIFIISSLVDLDSNYTRT